MYVCEEDKCVDQQQVECCVDPGCGPTVPCNGHHGHDNTHQHGNGGDCTGLEELEAWACTKEGCHAIQQYVRDLWRFLGLFLSSFNTPSFPEFRVLME